MGRERAETGFMGTCGRKKPPRLTPARHGFNGGQGTKPQRPKMAPGSARWAGRARGPIFKGMASGVWKGVGSGLILFFVIVAVGALTPLRIPLLKIAGRDYAALQLQEQAATSR